jgi:hypothetical protein
MNQKHIAADAGMCAAPSTTKTVLLFWILLVTTGCRGVVGPGDNTYSRTSNAGDGCDVIL